MNVLSKQSFIDQAITAISWNEKGFSLGTTMGEIHYAPFNPTSSTSLTGLQESKRIFTGNNAIASICNVDSRVFFTNIAGQLCLVDSLDTSKVITSMHRDSFSLAKSCTVPGLIVGLTTGLLTFIDNYNFKTFARVRISQVGVSSVAVSEELKMCVAVAGNVVYFVEMEQLKGLVGVKNPQLTCKSVEVAAEHCNSCVVTADGLSCVVTCRDGSIRIIDLISKKEVNCLLVRDSELLDIAYSQLNDLVFVTSVDGHVDSISLFPLFRKQSVRVNNQIVKAVAIKPNSNLIAVGGIDYFVYFIGLSHKEII